MMDKSTEKSKTSEANAWQEGATAIAFISQAACVHRLLFQYL